MEEIILNATLNKCKIICGEGAFEKYVPAIAARRCFIITDRDVFAYYRNLLWEVFGDNAPIYIMTAGESAKSFSTLKAVLGEMLNAGVNKDFTVVSFGGGVVGDVAGLAASLYMRGLDLVQIPTTLLAQADSSVGGKTAIDFGGVKNLIGSFYQPVEVISDPRFLSTLTDREIRCGLGEIIKCAALDGEILEGIKAARNLKDPAFLEWAAYKCAKLKARIVEEDEFDRNGARRALNLGHTTGHAFEEFYGKRSHGEYVMIGMYYEMYIAEKLGTGDKNYFEELKKLICGRIKVPSFEDIEVAVTRALSDKKNRGDKVTVIVPRSAGKCSALELTPQKYLSLLEECSASLGRRNGR